MSNGASAAKSRTHCEDLKNDLRLFFAIFEEQIKNNCLIL